MKFSSPDDRREPRRRQPPPNYFSRSVQVRVLMMVFSFLLVIVLMFEARKPQNWQWMWAGAKQPNPTLELTEPLDTRLSPEPTRREDPPGTVYANDDIVAPATDVTGLSQTVSQGSDSEVGSQRIRLEVWRGILKGLDRDERKTLIRVLRSSRSDFVLDAQDRQIWSPTFAKLDESWTEYLEKANQAVLVSGDELPREQRGQLLQALRVLEHEWTNSLSRALHAVLDEKPWSDSDRSALSQLQATLDELALSEVRDDMVWRPQEQMAWFRCLEKLQTLDEAALSTGSSDTVGFVQLFRQPQEYRGELVHVRGTAELAYRVAAPQNDLGITHYYVFWLRPGDGSDSPIVVYALRTPDQFPEIGTEHTTLHEDLSVSGYFFKRWAYQAHDGIRTAPLVLANTPTWFPAPPQPPIRLPSIGTTLAVVLAIALLAFSISRWVFRSSNSRPTEAISLTREATPEQFAALAEKKIGPTITEALRQREQRERGKSE